ncbi:putative cross-wall-targeting lipoprotein signal domain-containing proteiin, partial [Streptococcus sp. zg-JUN1979]|uniref:putative cross-wall-targeting lipoprotein signal domain-containing proteiin n=1 Tax=Streptococcus sp. zg-JUN1979 TaxID=3391450 RepID=UPI0039A4482E
MENKISKLRKAQERTVKGHGFFRKTKTAGLACGIILGTAIFAGGASADEVTVTTDTTPVVTTTANPATNLVEAQGQASSASTEVASQAGTQTGVLTQDVTSDALNTAVSQAQDAGVTVNQEATVSHDTLANAQADLASQTQAVEDATA